MILARSLHPSIRGAALAFACLQAIACSDTASPPPGLENSQLSEDSEVALSIRTAQREMRDGNLAEAGRLLDEARVIDPKNPALWVAIARLRFRGGEHLTAIDAADYALQLGPEYAPALLMRGQLVRDSNGLSESLPWFKAAIKADPKNAEAIGEYAATLGDVGRHRDMLEVIGRLSDLDQTNAQNLYLQAVLAARAGETVLARSLLDRSGWREANVPAAMQLDAIIDLDQGNADTAVETLAALSRRQPGNRRVRDLYARALWDAGRDEKLVAEMVTVIEGPDPSAYITMLVGRAYERLGQRAKAAPIIAKAYDMQEDGWRGLPPSAALGGELPRQTSEIRNLIAANNRAAANSKGESLKRQFPLSADALVLAGDAALANGDWDAALRDYTSSAQVRRPWPLTRKLLAASKRAGEIKAADAIASRYALSDPRNVDAVMAIMLQAKANGQWDRVAALADYAIALGAGQDPSLLNARLEAAKALNDEAGMARYQEFLEAVRPPKLVRE